MIIEGIEVSDDLMAEYIEKVRYLIQRSNELPVGVTIPMDDEERRAYHDIILLSVKQERGSVFSRKLSEYIDDLADKEGWFDA